MTTHINAGGITSYLRTLAKGLMANGHQVHIVSSGGNTADQLQSMGVKLLTLDIKTRSELNPKIYSALGEIKTYIRDNKIDIIHAHTRITQVMGSLLSKLTGKSYVSTCHGYFKKRLSRLLFPCWGERVIAISPAVKSHLIDDFHVPAQKIELIGSGIDADDFKLVEPTTRNSQRQKLNIAGGPVIGNIARLSDVKGPDILIEAMARILKTMPEVKLVLVGEGKMQAQLRQMVVSLKLEESVIFQTAVNRTAEYLPIFDVFVVPSRSEGLGLSAMEAQACGLPVVASNVGGLPSLIEDGKTGYLVEPQNPEKLAEKIVQVLKDAQQAQSVGLAGREFILQNYSVDQMVKKTVDFYNVIVEDTDDIALALERKTEDGEMDLDELKTFLKKDRKIK